MGEAVRGCSIHYCRGLRVRRRKISRPHARNVFAGLRGSHGSYSRHGLCCNGLRYQIKACRPSGKPGSFITWVPKATNYEWDRLVWLLYAASFNFLKLGSGMSQIINLRSILLNVSALRICVRVVGFMRESKHALNETL